LQFSNGRKVKNRFQNKAIAVAHVH
jgi:hypothetical protein